MKKLEIDFSSQSGEIQTIRWAIKEHQVAQLWFKILLMDLMKNEDMFTRFTGFDLPHKSVTELCNNLKKIREKINDSGIYFIKEKVPNTPDRAFFNIMHHHFEKMVYQEVDTKIRESGDYDLFYSIHAINHAVHDLEALDKNKNKDNGLSELLVITNEFATESYIPLSSEFDDLFDMNENFGDIFLIYPRIGKTLLEVFLDGDELINDPAIGPIDKIKSGFRLFFGETHHTHEIKQQFDKFLIKNGLDPKDKSLRNGNISIGLLEEDQTKEEVLGFLKQVKKLERIRLIQNQNTLIERSFDKKLVFTASL